MVARGFTQTCGIDYQETFAPVVKYGSVRTLLALTAAWDLKMWQFDVKTAYLHGNLNETIYMEQPRGFITDENQVCLLKKSIYGLKQAARQWNKRMTEYLVKHRLMQSQAVPCVYHKVSVDTGSRLYLLLYVHDELICSNDICETRILLQELYKTFKISVLQAESFVGFQIQRDERQKKIKIHQSAYAKKILEFFKLKECNPVSAPADPGIKFSRHNGNNEYQRAFPYRFNYVLDDRN